MSLTKKSLVLKAHAKINLHLNIGPRRRDGYHDLQTIFQEIELHDTLTISPAKSKNQFSLVNHTSCALKASPDNLVMKAIVLLQKTLKTDTPLKLHLEKRIPIGAGLGGGSSDAAAALVGGYQMLSGSSKGRPNSVLSDLARLLGADVSFFLKGGSAWAEGVGEQLKPLKIKKKSWLVLVYPRLHVSTPHAYRLLDQAREKGLSRRPFKKKAGPAPLYNSFEPVIDQQFPEVSRVKSVLANAGCRQILMSGSGSSVFGLVSSFHQGQSVLNKLKHEKWDIFLTRMI